MLNGYGILDYIFVARGFPVSSALNFLNHRSDAPSLVTVPIHAPHDSCFPECSVFDLAENFDYNAAFDDILTDRSFSWCYFAGMPKTEGTIATVQTDVPEYSSSTAEPAQIGTPRKPGFTSQHQHTFTNVQTTVSERSWPQDFDDHAFGIGPPPSTATPNAGKTHIEPELLQLSGNHEQTNATDFDSSSSLPTEAHQRRVDGEQANPQDLISCRYDGCPKLSRNKRADKYV